MYKKFVLLAVSVAVIGFVSKAQAAIHANAGGPYQVNEGDPVNLDGSASYADDGCYISTYRWSVGEGSSTRYGETVEYYYSSTGTYTATLHIEGYCGASAVSDEDSAEVQVLDVLPTAKISAFGTTNGGPFEDLIEEYVGRNITFDATNSFDASGSIVLYQWDLDYDGVHFSPDPRTSATINTSYPSAGTFTVALQVTDDEGSTAMATMVVRVLNPGPIARITGPESFPEGDARTYLGSSSSGGLTPPISLYEWDTNYDGETFVARESGADKDRVTVQFDNAGTYTIALRVWDSHSPPRSDTTYMTITVTNVPPVANLTGPDTFPEGEQQIFDASGSYANPGAIMRYQWDFDYDGTNFGSDLTTTVAQASHTWEDDGTYMIALMVTDDDGSTDIVSMTVHVEDLAPTATVVCPDSAQERQPAYFDASSSSSTPDLLVSFEWDFNYDGTNFNPFPNNAAPTAWFSFPDAGTYTVAVRVTDDDGSQSIATCQVTVQDSPPVAEITAPYTANEGERITIDGTASIEASRPDTIAKWEWDLHYDGSAFRPDSELGTGTTEFEFVPIDDGDYNIALRITDDDGSESIAVHTIEVANVPPHILSTPVTDAVEDEVYSYRVQAEDPAGPEDPLTFSLEIKPDGMEINPASGLIVWTPANENVRLNNRVKVKVCDDDGGCDTQSFNIIVQNVNDPPEIIGLSNDVGTTCEPFFATVRARDPDYGDTIYFYLDEKPDGMSIDMRSGDITWQPTVDNLGANQITVRVEDGNGGSTVDYFSITIYPCGEIPQVDAGEDFSVRPGRVQLHGRATDPHDPPMELTYHWQQTGGEPVNISGADTLDPVVILRKSGEYVFTLTASNGQYESIPDNITITVENIPPTPAIVCTPVVSAGDSFWLDGRLSGDMNADELEYSWSADDGLNLAENDLSKVEATASEAGTYEVELFVNDSFVSSQPVSSYVTVRSEDFFAPVASPARKRFSIKSGERAKLDATTVIFPAGVGIERSIEWSLVSGPVSVDTLVDFTPDATVQDVLFITPGIYKFKLMAYANSVSSIPGYVWVNVGETNNLPPVADAGEDFQTVVESDVQLDGSGSYDPESSDITYQWHQVSGPTVDLDNPNSPTPSFFALNSGVLVFELTVVDNRGLESLPSRVSVAVLPASLTLAACAGDDISVNPDEEVYIDATCSQHPEQFEPIWCQIEGEPVLLEDADSLTPHFLPPRPGRYTFMLSLVANGVFSNADTVSVSVLSEANHKPIADAGEDVHTNFGLVVRLDGSGSHDEDPSDVLEYDWSQRLDLSAGEVELRDADTATPSFVATVEGVLVFELRVYDGKMWSDPDTVAVTVNENQKPIANAGEDKQVYTGRSVTLDGSGSYDPDGEGITLSYRWEFEGDGENPLDDPTSVTPSFRVDKQGEYKFLLYVSDGFAESEPDEVSIIAIDDPSNSCLDRDHDGYGEGPGCIAEDCDDLDENKNAGIPGSCDVDIPTQPSGGGSSGGCTASGGFMLVGFAFLLLAFRKRSNLS